MNPNPNKPITFRFGEYISEGYELYRKNFGKVLLATFFLFVLSIIPFCSFMAQGNMFKFLKKLKGGTPEASEIFNFDDFAPYAKLFLILLAAILLLEIPLFVLIALGKDNPQEMPAYFPFYIIILVILLYILIAKAFYITGLISLKGVKSVREAWRISSEMTKGNLLIIVGFLLIASLLAQVGLIACVVGVFITYPIYYTSYFAAVDDGFKQKFNDQQLKNF